MKGTTTAISSPVLTAYEAAQWLRLDVDHKTEADAVAALQRIVRTGRLRPIRGTRPQRFWLGELERFVRDESTPDDGLPEGQSGGDLD